MHDRIEVPEPVTLVGDSAQLVLLVVRLTEPLNPLIGATVMVEVPWVFTETVTLVGLAVTVKSWTMKVTVAE